MRGGYQNGNGHFHTIKRYDCLVGDQNDHQLKSVRYGWVVSGQFVYLPLPSGELRFSWPTTEWPCYGNLVSTEKQHLPDFTVAWQNVKSKLSVTWIESMCSIWTHWTSCNVEDVSGEWRFVSFTTSTGHFDQLILGVPFSLHGFPAPFRRRFPARPHRVSSPGIPCRRSCGFQGSMKALKLD